MKPEPDSAQVAVPKSAQDFSKPEPDLAQALDVLCRIISSLRLNIIKTSLP
jgi:hypothetical protein